MRNNRSRIWNLLLVVGSLALAFLALEFGFRLLHIPPFPAVEKNPKPPEVNAQGRRDHGYGYEKKKGIFRIVAVGDSFTWGTGVSRLDDIFLMRLERRLNADHRGRYEIVNGSQNGWNTDDEYRWLESEGMRFEPDLIVVVYFFNDATHMLTNPLIANAIYRRATSRSESALVFWGFLKYRFWRYVLSRQTMQAYKAAYFEGDKTQLWHQCQADILAIQELARQNHSRLLLVVFPILMDLHHRYYFQDIHDIVVDFLRDHHIRFHSLLPALAAYPGKVESLWVSIDDAHPNEKGHAIAAQSIYEYLRDSDLIR